MATSLLRSPILAVILFVYWPIEQRSFLTTAILLASLAPTADRRTSGSNAESMARARIKSCPLLQARNPGIRHGAEMKLETDYLPNVGEGLGLWLKQKSCCVMAVGRYLRVDVT